MIPDLLQKKSVFLDVSQRIFPWKVCPSPRQRAVFELAARDSHFHSSARGENGEKGQNCQYTSVISDLFLLSGLDHRVSPAFNWPPLSLDEGGVVVVGWVRLFGSLNCLEAIFDCNSCYMNKVDLVFLNEVFIYTHR